MGQRTLYNQGCTVHDWNCGGYDYKNKITRCRPQHGELNQSTITWSRAQHTRLSRKEGKFNKDGRSQRGVLHMVGLDFSTQQRRAPCRVGLIKVGPRPSATFLSGHKHNNHKESTLLCLDAPAPQTSSSLVQAYEQGRGRGRASVFPYVHWSGS